MTALKIQSIDWYSDEANLFMDGETHQEGVLKDSKHL